jgi:hypothetical protein
VEKVVGRGEKNHLVNNMVISNWLINSLGANKNNPNIITYEFVHLKTGFRIQRTIHYVQYHNPEQIAKVLVDEVRELDRAFDYSKEENDNDRTSKAC